MGKSHRSDKVADRIKVVVAQLLETKIKDPRLGFVTITDARVPAASGTDKDPATGTTVNVYDLQGLESGTLQCQILIDRDKSWVADDPVNDPLNQRASVGWKGMRAAERLVEQYMVRMESVSSYSENASAN